MSTEFETALLDLSPHFEHVLVLGDFNTNLLATESPATREILTLFESYNMIILPLLPTHHTATSETLLDLIITKYTDRVLSYGQLTAPGTSAHDIIYLTYSLQSPKMKPNTITFHDLKRIDETSFFAIAIALAHDLDCTLSG